MATPIVHNTGTNFTLYYNVLNYFKTIMTNHPSIEAVTQGDISSIDVDQFPNYPLGNILITDTSFGTSVTTYQIQLTVADKIKNKNNESNERTNDQIINQILGVNDVVDIHANTLAILNDLTSYTQRGVAGFEINGDINCKAFSDEFNNGLAGWVANFELTTHNDKNRCLFFLLGDNGFIIEDCQTGLRYKAILSQSTYPSINFGDYFYTLKSPNLSNTYGNLVCYSIVEQIKSVDFNFVNLPVLQPGILQSCQLCNLWINPKVWSTTPAAWSGADAEFRTWSTV
jgi:hypothetical protein